MVGTDHFSLSGPATIAEIMALNRLGMTPAAVLKSATLEPARYLGREGQLGEVAVGAQADLILLIGPSFEHSGIEKRDVSIISTTDRIRSRFNVSANPAIVVARAIKQALNFLRLSLKRSKI